MKFTRSRFKYRTYLENGEIYLMKSSNITTCLQEKSYCWWWKIVWITKFEIILAWRKSKWYPFLISSTRVASVLTVTLDTPSTPGVHSTLVPPVPSVTPVILVTAETSWNQYWSTILLLLYHGHIGVISPCCLN